MILNTTDIEREYQLPYQLFFFFDRNVLIFCSESAAVFFSIRLRNFFSGALFPVRDDKNWQGLLYCNRIAFKKSRLVFIHFIFIIYFIFHFFYKEIGKILIA